MTDSKIDPEVEKEISYISKTIKDALGANLIGDNYTNSHKMEKDLFNSKKEFFEQVVSPIIKEKCEELGIDFSKIKVDFKSMNVSENKLLTPNEFVVIIDKYGDVTETSVLNDDNIQSAIRTANKNYPDDAPHSALYWNGKEWNQWL